METFYSPRLQMRPLAEGDDAIYLALYTDPDVMTHIAAPLVPDVARAGFERSCHLNAEPGGWVSRWAVLDRASGAALGLLAVLRDPGDPGTAEIGVMLLPAAQGRGFAREVVGALVALVFSACPGIDRVWARHRVDHAAAAALMRAVGFPVESACGKRATCSRTRPLDSPVCMARPGGS